jgi:hypothetical protein
VGKIFEHFGFRAGDPSDSAKSARRASRCPFLELQCTKKINVREREALISGVCSMRGPGDLPVAVCPIRMYAGNYQILRDVSVRAFNADLPLVSSDAVQDYKASGEFVAVFGQRWGKELRLSKRRGRGSYSVDWVLARLSASKQLVEFTAVEVQTIDTTGNYRDEVRALNEGSEYIGPTTANFNWENVNKRILPQIIYKGHVLRREPLCTKGLFFVCPTAVYGRILERLGGTLSDIHPSSGALTFCHYSINPEGACGTPLALEFAGARTTTVDQVALAFTSPQNLPDIMSYELAIRHALQE